MCFLAVSSCLCPCHLVIPPPSPVVERTPSQPHVLHVTTQWGSMGTRPLTAGQQFLTIPHHHGHPPILSPGPLLHPSHRRPLPISGCWLFGDPFLVWAMVATPGVLRFPDPETGSHVAQPYIRSQSHGQICITSPVWQHQLPRVKEACCPQHDPSPGPLTHHPGTYTQIHEAHESLARSSVGYMKSVNRSSVTSLWPYSSLTWVTCGEPSRAM